MRILCPISSYQDPASRFRILQYKEYLKTQGTELQIKTFFPPKESDPPKALNIFSEKLNRKAWNFLQYYNRKKYFTQEHSWDMVWQNRLLLCNTSSLEKQIKKPRVFDFDDAIWMTEGKEQVDTAIATADLVFAGNDLLADYAMKLNESTELVPTTVDTSKYFKANRSPVFTLGWIGTKSNFQYLDMIRKPLHDFLAKEKKARLLIVSSEPPPNFAFNEENIFFKKWTAENENELLNEFSVGLMPLADDEWCKGKCSAKMLQYMACEIPVIVSPVGNNKKILSGANAGLNASTDEDWSKAFQRLFNEPETAKGMGRNGRRLVEKDYATNIWAEKIFTHFKHLLQ